MRLLSLSAAALTVSLALVAFDALGEPSWAPGYDSTATIKTVLKYRHLFNPGRNGYEGSLGPAESPPYSTLDFYRGATCDGATVYGNWNPSGVNHVTLTYDPIAGTVSARVDAAYPYCLSYAVGALGPLNYLQLDLRGQEAGTTSEIVSFAGAVLNGEPLEDVVGITAPSSWSLTGVDLTAGFTLSGDMVLTWPPSNTGCDECNRLVLRVGWVEPPTPASSAPAAPSLAWALAAGLLAWLGARRLRRA